MLVHQDMVTREKTWETFRDSPDWKTLSSNPAYANTVSAVTAFFLRPTAYSQI
jgi:NIPSNAP